jgi:putative ATPase
MLFTTTSTQPLADKLRPIDISAIVGQEHLFDENGIITRILESKKIPSMILWGPAGC